MTSSSKTTMDRMSFVSKDSWKKFPLDEPRELKRSNEFKHYPQHFWKLKAASLFPISIFFFIVEPDTSISYTHIHFILNTRNGYPEDSNNETSDDLSISALELCQDRLPFQEWSPRKFQIKGHVYLIYWPDTKCYLPPTQTQFRVAHKLKTHRVFQTSLFSMYKRWQRTF